MRCDLWTCLKVRQRREVATKGRATRKVNLRGDIPKTRTVLDVPTLPLSLFLPLRTNLRQFIMWLYPIAKATGLEWSPACSISLVLTTSPPSFTFAHVLWQTKFMFFTRFAYALNKSLFSLLFSLVSFLFFYLCFTYFPLCLWLLCLLLFVDDFSFNLFPLFLIIFDNFEKSFFMRMIHNCHKDRDKVIEMRERWEKIDSQWGVLNYGPRELWLKASGEGGGTVIRLWKSICGKSSNPLRRSYYR